MSSHYFVISEIKDLPHCFAIKEIEVDEELSINDERLKFDIEGSNTIYIGKDTHETNIQHRIRWSLADYRTKINPNLYKIELSIALGRIAYGCENLLIKPPITKAFLSAALKLENIRQQKLQNPVELEGKQKALIHKSYLNVEDSWLSYWKKSKERLIAFYKKYPEPIKENYAQSGINSLIWGKFNEDKFNKDRIDQHQRLDWLCKEIANESKDLSLGFTAECPGNCKRQIGFSIAFDRCNGDQFIANDSNFPYKIYKKLQNVTGSCPECGGFEITYSHDSNAYTCLCINYWPEFIAVIERIIKQIAYSIKAE